MTSSENTVRIPRYNVLVVDDDEAVRQLVVIVLSQRGHQCLQAVDGVDALGKAAANEFHAIITDILMPEMDGITLTRELLKQNPKLPIMVITGHDNVVSSITAIAAGAREFVRKPFSVIEFGVRFQKMMRDHELLLENEAKQREALFHIQKRSFEEITDLKRDIENLKNRLHAGYPRSFR